MTFIPGIRLALTGIRRYITDHKDKLIQNMGEGLYSVIEFILDLVGIALAIIDQQDGQPGDAFEALGTLSSGQINQVEAAIAKWRASNGLGGGS